MRLRCIGCRKIVSTEVPDDTVVRGLLTCPECYHEECNRMDARFGSAIDELRIGVGREPVREPYQG